MTNQRLGRLWGGFFFGSRLLLHQPEGFQSLAELFRILQDVVRREEIIRHNSLAIHHLDLRRRGEEGVRVGVKAGTAEPIGRHQFGLHQALLLVVRHPAEETRRHLGPEGVGIYPIDVLSLHQTHGGFVSGLRLFVGEWPYNGGLKIETLKIKNNH